MINNIKPRMLILISFIISSFMLSAFFNNCSPVKFSAVESKLTDDISDLSSNDDGSCFFIDKNVKNGDAVTAWNVGTATSKTKCQSEVRTCINGKFDGTYTFNSCLPGDEATVSICASGKGLYCDTDGAPAACTNAPANSIYTGSGGKADNCPWKCKETYTLETSTNTCKQPSAPAPQPQTICSAQQGYYCETTSSTTTKQCEIGYFCPGGALTHQQCTVGSYCNIVGLSTPIGCTAGYSCTTPGLTTAPTTCISGYEFVNNQCQLKPQAIVCQAQAGSYCPPGATSPQSFPLGNYCAGGTAQIETCPIGYYCPNSATKTQCPAGYSCTNSGLTSLPSPTTITPSLSFSYPAAGGLLEDNGYISGNCNLSNGSSFFIRGYNPDGTMVFADAITCDNGAWLYAISSRITSLLSNGSNHNFNLNYSGIDYAQRSFNLAMRALTFSSPNENSTIKSNDVVSGSCNYQSYETFDILTHSSTTGNIIFRKSLTCNQGSWSWTVSSTDVSTLIQHGSSFRFNLNRSGVDVNERSYSVATTPIPIAWDANYNTSTYPFTNLLVFNGSTPSSFGAHTNAGGGDMAIDFPTINGTGQLQACYSISDSAGSTHSPLDSSNAPYWISLDQTSATASSNIYNSTKTYRCLNIQAPNRLFRLVIPGSYLFKGSIYVNITETYTSVNRTIGFY